MTLILGYRTEFEVYLLADSGSTDAWNTVRVTVTPKLVGLTPRILIGSSGSWRAINLLEHYAPEIAATLEETDYADPDGLVSRVLVPAFRELWAKHGLQGKKDGVETQGSEMLLAVAGSEDAHLYLVQSDWSVIEDESAYAAIGSGESFAKGALAALSGLDYTVEMMLTNTANAVQRCGACGVLPPWTMRKVRVPDHVE